MNKQPEVTARAHKKYIEAFWEEYRVRPVEKIPIAALSKAVGFNRTTFYLYFEDIYDIRRQAEDELIAEYNAKLHALIPDGVDTAAKPVMVEALVQLFDAYRDKLMILTGENGDPSFQSRLEEQSRPLMRNILGTDAGVCTNYIVSYVFGAISGILRYWYRNGKKLAEEELIALIYGMISEGSVETILSMGASLPV